MEMGMIVLCHAGRHLKLCQTLSRKVYPCLQKMKIYIVFPPGIYAS